MRRVICLSLYTAVLLCYSAILVQAGTAADPISVFVSIVPQQYFVQQIGKDFVHVQVMVQPGASPATYEPKPRQMAAISKAEIYFAVGVPFEKVWLEKIAAASSKMRVVHTDHGIDKISMTADHHHDGEERGHKAGPHQDEHGEPDPHIWLSPPLVKIQARTILAALQEIDPARSAAYQRNHDQFVSAIDLLHDQLKRTFVGHQGHRFLVFHPAWGYFAHTYGIEEVPIEVEGKSPKPARLKMLIERARREGIRMVFVQPQFSTKSAQLIAREIGGQVVVADPLAKDWMDNLRNIAEKFKAALK